MAKNFFDVLKKKKTNKKQLKTVKKQDKKVLRQKIMYILATMKFKTNTIMFVRSVNKIIEKNKKLSKLQEKTLNTIYAEWIAGRPVKKAKTTTTTIKKVLRG